MSQRKGVLLVVTKKGALLVVTPKAPVSIIWACQQCLFFSVPAVGVPAVMEVAVRQQCLLF